MPKESFDSLSSNSISFTSILNQLDFGSGILSWVHGGDG
jgi:hypothetical protein